MREEEGWFAKELGISIGVSVDWFDAHRISVYLHSFCICRIWVGVRAWSYTMSRRRHACMIWAGGWWRSGVLGSDEINTTDRLWFMWNE